MGRAEVQGWENDAGWLNPPRVAGNPLARATPWLGPNDADYSGVIIIGVIIIGVIILGLKNSPHPFQKVGGVSNQQEMNTQTLLPGTKPPLLNTPRRKNTTGSHGAQQGGGREAEAARTATNHPRG